MERMLWKMVDSSPQTAGKRPSSLNTGDVKGGCCGLGGGGFVRVHCGGEAMG